MTGGKICFVKKATVFSLFKINFFINKPLGSWIMLKLIVEYCEFYIKNIHRYKKTRFVEKEGDIFQKITF